MKGVIWRSQSEPLHELQLQTLTCFRLQTWFGVNGDGSEGDDSAEETAAAEREMSAQNRELQLCPLLLSRSGKALFKKQKMFELSVDQKTDERIKFCLVYMSHSFETLCKMQALKTVQVAAFILY